MKAHDRVGWRRVREESRRSTACGHVPDETGIGLFFRPGFRNAIASLVTGLLLVATFACRRDPLPVASPKYVGSAACMPCHEGEFERWRVSMHADAAQLSTSSNVRSNFDGIRRSLPSGTIRPLRVDDALRVEMSAPDAGNLDSANATELHQLFFDLRKKFNQTFLIVTHNEELAQLSDRVLHMKDGKII
jgi:hypothetical protein